MYTSCVYIHAYINIYAEEQLELNCKSGPNIWLCVRPVYNFLTQATLRGHTKIRPDATVSRPDAVRVSRDSNP